MILNRAEYLNKVAGCWMGKNIGGTLGDPFEWRRQVNQVSFYTQDLQGEPLPNDDLDIQLLWLIALEERGVDIDSHLLSEYWLLYVTPHWVEYGNAKVNLRSGLVPPLSGAFNNPYKDSCGAFIRAEIWACIAPGCPQQAANYAFQDAIIDHGLGEGTYAEVFIATLEAAAFVIQDIPKLIEIGLSYIPVDCAVANVVHFVQKECFEKGLTWQEARNLVLEKFRGSPFYNDLERVDPEDRARGFDQGKFGWDVPSNIGMLMIGLLYGEGDFTKILTTAVNCGEDTDCTAATAGSIYGILHGLDAIPVSWRTPIGHKIKTACLNLGELGHYGSQLPADIDELTRRTEQIARKVLEWFQLPITLSDNPTDLSGLKDTALFADSQADLAVKYYANPNGPLFRFDFFDVSVDYGESPEICDNTPKSITLTVWNKYKNQAIVYVRWLVPDDWTITPSREGQFYIFIRKGYANPRKLSFTLQAPRLPGAITRLAVELVIDARPQVILVPITLVNGNVKAD
jgi:ADP-ribosylglycohydrolase